MDKPVDPDPRRALLDQKDAEAERGGGEARVAKQHRDGKLTCNAELTFRLVEFPNDEFRANMEKMAVILQFPNRILANG